MANVKVNRPELVETASQKIIADAATTVTVTDIDGREIEIRNLDATLKRRIYKALSAENQRKEQYLGMVFLAACVLKIDGEPVKFPSSELLFDALIDRLGDNGLDAIGAGANEHFLKKRQETELGE